MRKLLVVLGLVGAAGAQAAEPAHLVQDPHYGEVLFQFFQERYFSSITELMASEQFSRVAHHADEAEVLRGGLLLSYGLHEQSGQVFEQVLARSPSQAVKDRAWFYLAKVRYQRGLDDAALEALSRVAMPLPGGLEEERQLLRADILLAKPDLPAAAQVLAGMAGPSTAGRYARFNLGVALVRSGQVEEGRRWLDQLGQEPAVDEEQRSLRDRANLALGFAALQDGSSELARSTLERIRLQGPEAGKALLGLGWAEAALKHPEQALVPWTELQKREPADAAVLESGLAVAYGFAEAGAPGEARRRYEQAIAGYEKESAALDQSLAAIGEGRFVEALARLNPGEEMGWFWRLDQVPALPHAVHLTALLSQHRFQEAFKNYRDLRFLQDNLRKWSEDIAVYGDMLQARRQAFADRLPKALEASRDHGLAASKQRRESLAQELAEAEKAADGAAFSDETERSLAARLKAVDRVLAEHPDDPDLAEARERARRARGALDWRLSQAYPARDWQARKALAALDSQLDQAAKAETDLVQAAQREPERFAAFDSRVAQLRSRIASLQPRVDALASAQQQALQALAGQVLQGQKQRLADYVVQARFALAQLADRSADRSQQASEGGPHAARP